MGHRSDKSFNAILTLKPDPCSLPWTSYVIVLLETGCYTSLMLQFQTIDDISRCNAYCQTLLIHSFAACFSFCYGFIFVLLFPLDSLTMSYKCVFYSTELLHWKPCKCLMLYRQGMCSYYEVTWSSCYRLHKHTLSWKCAHDITSSWAYCQVAPHLERNVWCFSFCLNKVPIKRSGMCNRHFRNWRTSKIHSDHWIYVIYV